MDAQKGSSSQAAVQETSSSGVELLAFRGLPRGGSSGYSSMQVNRSSSYTARASTDGSVDSEQWEPMDAAQRHQGASSSAMSAPGWLQPGFEPFEVEEQEGTEVKYLKGALLKKEEECEHLRSIIKEMSHSRQAVAKTKVELEEQYAALQREYFRVVKVSELARSVSSEAMGRINRIKAELHTAKEEALRARRQARHASDQVSGLQSENAALRARLDLLEEAVLAQDCKTSVCAREYMYTRVTLY